MNIKALKTVKTWDNSTTLNKLVDIAQNTELTICGQAMEICEIIEALDLANNNSFYRHLEAELNYLDNMSSWTYSHRARFEALEDIQATIEAMAD